MRLFVPSTLLSLFAFRVVSARVSREARGVLTCSSMPIISESFLRRCSYCCRKVEKRIRLSWISVSFSFSSYSLCRHRSSSLHRTRAAHHLESPVSHLPARVQLLLFKGLLHFVLHAPLFQKPCRRGHNVKLHMLGLVDLLFVGAVTGFHYNLN